MRGVQPRAGAGQRRRDGGGGELGAVAPRQAGEDHPGRCGELARVADDHEHGLHAATADVPGLAAHLTVTGHRCPLKRLRGAAGRVERVAQVPQGIGFSVAVSGQRGAHRRQQVGPVQSRGAQLVGQPRDVGRQCGAVGERRADVPPRGGQRRRGGREAGHDVTRRRVAGHDFGDVHGGIRECSGHAGITPFAALARSQVNPLDDRGQRVIDLRARLKCRRRGNRRSCTGGHCHKRRPMNRQAR